MDFIIGAASAVTAVIFTNPLEVVKIRMQLQGELKARGEHPVHFRNVFHAALVIARHDGLLALQAGLVPAIWFQIFLNGSRFGSFQFLDQQGYLRDNEGAPIFYRSVLFGGLGGCFGALIASPFYLIKTHLQSQASNDIAFGHQHAHKSTWTALTSIYSEFGVRGLFRGSQAAVIRAFVGSTTQLTSFVFCKMYIERISIFEDRPLLTTFAASMISGIAISLTMTPFDLISTRLYNQGVGINGEGLLYKGYLDCVWKVWKSEGVLAFYKGLGASYFRLGPHTMLCLIFWDQYKYLYKELMQFIIKEKFFSCDS